MTDKELLLKAIEARELAYAPYSNHKVGAALVGKSGKIYLGCNVENAAYTPTNCAERTAIFKAVSEGEREFTAIAVVGGLGDKLSDVCAPCGVCRQVMAEFCTDDFIVIIGKTEDDYRVHSLSDVLPFTFREPDLHK